MIVSDDDQRIALGIGKQFIKSQYITTEIVLYKFDEQEGIFEIEKIIDNRYLDACPSFLFRKDKPNELIFFT